jgi:glycosyltransferase involved in cell wall biosynthesis
VINFFNKVWQLPIGVARWTGLAQPMLRQNWLSVSDMKNLMRVAGFESISGWGEVILPFRVPLLSAAFNRFLVKLWPLNHLALTQFLVARPDPFRNEPALTASSTVSVVIPARNEAGHIREILERVPTMGSSTEILFVEGNSTDNTLDVIQEAVKELDDPNVRCYQQPGHGKGDAVRFGYQHATGDVLMILDADMTVAPEDLPRFFEAIANGSGEFINGVRLVYPMEDEAMQFLNYLGNKFFGLTFSWLLRQPVKDTLCGTKVLSRNAYDTIAQNRSYFGDFDPFGDFDLLFGAAKQNLKIVDIPIRYRQRRYGSTNIDRWRHGAILLRMAWFAARKLRFV